MRSPDFLVIGAGIVGLTVARALQRRYPDASVTVIDKEAKLGAHASGRNSGVLHAGFYYTGDSLKARFCRDGNRAWQRFCEERGLPLDRCGKLVVARDEEELTGLRTLAERGCQNGVELHWLDEHEAREIEPRVQVFQSALYSPATATVDPLQLLNALRSEFTACGGTLELGSEFLSADARTTGVKTSRGEITAGYVVNCAGLYADRVAHDFGFGRDYEVLPVKGVYLHSDRRDVTPRAHIYPVPDVDMPFLGVHFTRLFDGGAKIGPTATPVLWREHYGGLRGFRVREFAQVLGREVTMFARNTSGFRRLVAEEVRKQFKRRLIHEAGRLLSGADAMGFRRWGRPGIRAQLVDRRSLHLQMDFVVEPGGRSCHVLNAVSPALTSAFPFAEHVVDLIEEAQSQSS